MLCPVCKAESLQSVKLSDGPWAHCCSHCQGHWITAEEYWQWLQNHGDTLPEKAPSNTAPPPVEDENTRRVKLCPNCDRLLAKYRLHTELPFRLDHCGHCGGIWLDSQEWDALKDRNLHDEIYQLITPHRQKQLQQENSRRHFEQRYQERFGAEDYAEIRRIKKWLWENSNRQDLLTYLNDEESYIA